jgi:hypothetical protein
MSNKKRRAPRTDGHSWMVTFSEMGGQNPGYETAMTSYEMMSDTSTAPFPGTSSKILIYFAVGRISQLFHHVTQMDL